MDHVDEIVEEIRTRAFALDCVKNDNLLKDLASQKSSPLDDVL